MVICNFFLQGRCKFGDRCWNEHSRDGRHQGHNRYQSQGSAASSSWNSSGQRYVQPSNFSRNLTWTRENDRSSFASGPSDNRNRSSKPNAPSGFFSPQNRYSALANQDHSRDTGQDKEENLLAEVVQDLEMWESSGQWQLSVYCVLKDQRHLSGFTDISPEELRLECYTSLKEGHLQNYVSSVQQLLIQWKQRVHDIKNSSNAALLGQLIMPPTAATARPSLGSPQQSGSFGSPQQSGSFGGPQQSGSFGGPQQSGSFGSAQQSGFGTSSTSDNKPSAASFSFKLGSHTAAPNAVASSGFSSVPAFGSKPSFGFGNAGTGSASTFSFAPTTTSGGAAPTGFGSASTAPGMAASGFGSSVSSGFGGTTTGGFGSSVSAVPSFGGTPSASGFGGLSSSTTTSGFGAGTTGASSPSTAGTSLFGQVVTASSASSAVGTSAANTTSSPLFTPRNQLSHEDLLQYESKMFTLGKVPLVPPPLELLMIK